MKFFLARQNLLKFVPSKFHSDRLRNKKKPRGGSKNRIFEWQAPIRAGLCRASSFGARITPYKFPVGPMPGSRCTSAYKKASCASHLYILSSGSDHVIVTMLKSWRVEREEHSKDERRWSICI